MSATMPCQDWPEVLEACVESCARFSKITILRETDSTQDAAMRLSASPGEIITTCRQTKGKGRLGRHWADTGGEGIAVTFVLAPAPPERLAMLSAVAAARAAEKLLGSADDAPAVGIRWPNDIVVAVRKLAGILVEQDNRTARVGIGINIAQQSFPHDIADRACSLTQLGRTIDRAHAITNLITCMDTTIGESNDELMREFTKRDVLRGCTASFEHDRSKFTGRVLEVDPSRGLRVATDSGEVFLPAHATSLLAVE